MKRIISIVLSFILVFTLCPSVFAASNITWTGASNDNWNVAGNWSPAQVPSLGDTAVIPASTVAAVVYDTTSVTLDCSGEVSVESGKTLSLTGTSYLKGTGKLSGNGDITITDGSDFLWSGGSIEGNGTFTVEDNTRLVIEAGSEVGMLRPLANNGQVMLNAGGLYLAGGGGGTGTFTVSDGAYLCFEQGDYSFGGDFVNGGEMTIWDDSSVRFDASYQQGSTGTLALKIWGAGSDGYCKLDVVGAAKLGGILEIDFITLPEEEDYIPQPGDTFEIVTCVSRTGEFSEININMEGITLVPAYTDTGLTLTVPAASGNVCKIGATEYATLDAALTAVQSGETIKLLEDIDYNSGIVIEDKSITFDLNGFNLNVVNNAEGDSPEEMSGLYVKGNAAVSFEDEGEFNVTGAWYGVFAECEEGESAEVTVTNATGNGLDGVAAQRSRVTVKGNATSNGSGSDGVWASYNAKVTVEGDVYADGNLSHGVYAKTLGVVTVKGDVIVNGDDSKGVMVQDDSNVTVEGNITVSGDNGTGVYLIDIEERLSFVTINGEIAAPVYIIMDSEYDYEWNPDEGNYIAEESESHLLYSGYWGSTIYVSAYSGGSGTADDPYLISNATQLNAIRYLSYRDFWDGGKHYKLVKDIDLGGWYSLVEGWYPIGNGEVPFIGTLDGDGHTISNLRINREGENCIGLFANIGLGAEIRNVGLIDADVTGQRDVGGLVGVNYYGLITDSYVTGKVTGTSGTGGLTGYNGGPVTDSYFEGTVTATEGCAGGLVGCNYEEGSITRCSAVATVESEGSVIGGLAGASSGSITDSYAISTVTGAEFVGGVTGDNGGLVNNSYADGDVIGTYRVGGLVGSNGYTINSSYFTGTVTASGDYSGGLAGESSGSIEGCHADATVTSTGDYVGGLAGGSIGLITSSYSTGAVTGGSHVGGLVGASFSNAGSGGISEGISASYSSGAVAGKMYVGGLVGNNETRICLSFAKGSVTGTENDTDNTYAGGLVGHNTGPISDSYAWGAVSGQDMIGGLVGYNEAGITNCYEIGAVTGDSYTGGLIGSNHPGAEIIGSFWNNNTSGQSSSDGGISKGSVAMKQQVTYDSNVEADWDFETIWGIDLVQPSAFNDGYPFLRWQVGAEFAGGSGTEGDPYLVATADHLNNVRNHLDKHFRQIADLDLSFYRSGSGWNPIGTSTNRFTGTYDGDGHIISALFINQIGAWNVRIPAGLFGYIGAEAKVRDLTLKNVDVTGCYYVGSLVGNNSGDITNVFIMNSTVTGEYDTGGLVGLNHGSITDSAFTGAVTGTDKIEYGDWTGGLVGYNYGTITRCWAGATVVSAGDNVGGLVGENLTEGIITESCSAGTVTADDYIGGLAGANSGEITACYSICTVNGDSNVGGLIGGNSGPIADSFAAGAVAGTNRIGGLAGSSTGATVTGCYWDTEASGQSTSASGTGKITAEMKQRTTFENWDFVAIWDINAGFNAGYPFLRWQVTATVWEVANATQLEAALNGFQSGDTIKLTADFTYNKGIVIDGKDIIFDTGSFTLNVYSSTDSSPGVGLEVKNGGNVYLIGSGQLYIRQIGGNNSYGVKVTDGSTAMVTNVQVTVFQNDAGVGAYADGTDSSIHVLGNVRVAGVGGCGAKTVGRGRITVDGTITATIYINIGSTYKDKSSGVDDPAKPGYLKYSTDPVTGIVWVKASPVTVPTAPQNFAPTPGDGQVALSWAAPASDGGSAITKYQVSEDNGANWTDVGLNTSHTFTGLTNGTAYTFKVRAVNSAGNGEEASAAATPAAAPATAYTVTINGSYAATTGAGSYAQGATVTISAGGRSSYTFAGWTSSDGVTFTNANNATTTFTMPDKDVTITANWSYNGSSGGSSGGGSSTPTTPTAPAYKADVKAGSGAETTIPVTVDKDAGTASVDAGSRNLDQSGTIITIPSIPGVGAYSVGIPVPDLSTTDVQGTLTVNTDTGNVTVPSNMLTGVSGISGSKAEIAIGQGDKDNLPDAVKAAIGDRPLVQLSLSIDGKQTDWSNPDAPVTVSIPYTPTAAEFANPESIIVWYIDGSGNVVSVPNGHYDPATGMVTFTTTHFSDYAVVYNKVSFNDVTVGAWYHKAISFIAARGITGGTGNGNYSPEVKLTRGQFIVMLMKAYGIAPDTNPKDNFSDAGGTYYTGYLAAAKRLGVSAGIGNNMFAPEKEITRQEMFTLLYNALKVIGKLPQGDSGKTLDHFSDAGQIDSWAKEAMRLMVKTGTIGGNAGKLNPTSTTTRAEMAQVLYNLLSK